MSHIIIDLGRTTSGPPLSASSLGQRKALGHRKRKVKSALILAQQAKSYIPWHSTDRNHVKTILQALGDFPNLTVLTVDLSYWKLRVATLSVLLQATKGLKELTLRNLVLTGNLCDQSELENVLACHSNIQNLCLDRCRGTATVRTLLTKMTSLRKAKVISSRISQSDVWASVTLVEMCAISPKLRSLSLQDVLDLEDQHIVQLVEALRSKNAPVLQEFHLTSSNTGHMAGNAIFSMLQNGCSGNNCSLSKLTLNLGGSWTNLASSVDKVLSHTTTLRKLQLRITGKSQDAVSTTIQIAKALSCSERRLTYLELQMDLALSNSSEEYQQIMKAFESALTSNHTLEGLRFCDSQCQETDLTPPVRMKLDLNRSGLLKLLHNSNDQSIPTDLYLKAMTRANENLSVLFYALHNNPALFCKATQATPPAFDLHSCLAKANRNPKVHPCVRHRVAASSRTSDYFNAANISRREALDSF